MTHPPPKPLGDADDEMPTATENPAPPNAPHAAPQPEGRRATLDGAVPIAPFAVMPLSTAPPLAASAAEDTDPQQHAAALPASAAAPGVVPAAPAAPASLSGVTPLAGAAPLTRKPPEDMHPPRPAAASPELRAPTWVIHPSLGAPDADQLTPVGGSRFPEPITQARKVAKPRLGALGWALVVVASCTAAFMTALGFTEAEVHELEPPRPLEGLPPPPPAAPLADVRWEPSLMPMADPKDMTEPRRLGPRSGTPGKADVPGTVRIITTPETSIFVDGKSVGSQPVTLRLAPGRNTLVFQNPKLGLKRVVWLDVRPGEKSIFRRDFGKGWLRIGGPESSQYSVDGIAVSRGLNHFEVWEGLHKIDVVHTDRNGTRVSQVAEVFAGKTTPVYFDAPVSRTPKGASP